MLTFRWPMVLSFIIAHLRAMLALSITFETCSSIYGKYTADQVFVGTKNRRVDNYTQTTSVRNRAAPSPTRDKATTTRTSNFHFNSCLLSLTNNETAKQAMPSFVSSQVTSAHMVAHMRAHTLYQTYGESR